MNQSVTTGTSPTFTGVNLGTSTLDDYIETTHTSATTGAFVGTEVFTIRKIGKIVTLTSDAIPATTSGEAAVITYSTALPAAYRPATEQYCLVVGQDNSVAATLSVKITTAGVITVGLVTLNSGGIHNAFTGSNNVQVPSYTISYATSV